MDTDTVFLSSPVDVWRHFGVMNATQMAAVAPEHEDYATGWYNRFARHPYYGNLGSLPRPRSVRPIRRGPQQIS